jgi:nanoRNase/pAp phosphatase (c-di-AMP/oligoRNAs hydrolase)
MSCVQLSRSSDRGMLEPTRDPIFSSFVNAFFLAIEQASEIVLISHENMDPDAIGSILGVMALIQERFPGKHAINVFPRSISKLSRKLLDTWTITLPFLDSLAERTFVPVLLDTQSIGAVMKSNNPNILALQQQAIILDHHHDKQGLSSRLRFTSTVVQANCELVLQLFKEAGSMPRHPTSSALLAGILFDSGFLRYAKNSTINAVHSLLATGLVLDDFRQLLSESMDASERIARIKAGMRCNITRAGDAIIAASAVSTFEASACRGLIGLGADFALVLAETKDEIRISARQTDDARKRHGVNLASIMQSIGNVIGGTGGGHDLAAAASGVKEGQEGLKQAIKAIENIIHARNEKT